MDENAKRDAVRNEMADLSLDFLGFYGDYYSDKGNDAELLELTTQPFWQSMRLSKRRLASKGVKLDVELYAIDTREAFRRGRVYVSKDGNHLVGKSTRSILVKRRFLKNNKAIYSRKEIEISNMSLLKADVDGDTAVCPNCGHEGTVQSFIDGCDACGSRFRVKDFASKISAFALEEHVGEKLNKTVGRTAIALGIVNAALVGFGLLCYILMIGLLWLGQDGTNTFLALIGFVMSLDLVSVSFWSLVSIPFLHMLLKIVLVPHYDKRYTGEGIVKAIFPDFSAEDFCQNLEYKLRNIHLTDNASEVAVFAGCSLERVVEKYRDVVDCNVTRYRFLGAQALDGGYRIQVEVTMKLARYNGRRIRNKYEKLVLTLFGRDEVVQRKTAALREYKCPGCGSSINILEGSVCKACDSVFDYGDYGWKIEKYNIAKKPANIYGLVRLGMVAVYVLVFALRIFWTETEGGESTWLTMYQEYASQKKVTDMLYGDVTMPNDLDTKVRLESMTDNVITREATYFAQDSAAIAEKYLERVVAEGFVCDESAGGENKYVLYRPLELNGEVGYLKMTITASGDSLTVLLEALEIAEE